MYNVLYNYDSDFSKYFKIFVDFDNEMDKNENKFVENEKPSIN